MTTLTHPHIDPPLVIEVAPERVDDHLRAGWLLDPEDADRTPPSITDPDLLPGEDHDHSEE